MKKATLIKVDGTQIDVKPKDGDHFSYEELRAFVCPNNDGLVEMVPLPSGKVLVGNEEGKLIGLQKNEVATEMWKQEYPIEKYPHNNDELIVGDVLITDEAYLEI